MHPDVEQPSDARRHRRHQQLQLVGRHPAGPARRLGDDHESVGVCQLGLECGGRERHVDAARLEFAHRAQRLRPERRRASGYEDERARPQLRRRRGGRDRPEGGGRGLGTARATELGQRGVDPLVPLVHSFCSCHSLGGGRGHSLR